MRVRPSGGDSTRPPRDPYASRTRSVILAVQRLLYALGLQLRRLRHGAASRLARLSPMRVWMWRETALGRRWLRRLLAAFVACAVGAVIAGVATRFPGRDGGVEAYSSPTTEVGTSLFRLQVPKGWSKASLPPPLPGLASDQTLVLVDGASKIRLVAALLPATSSTLVPQPVLDQLTRPPRRPERVTLGGRLPAYYYSDLTVKGGAGVQEFYVTPTTDGVATVACFGDTRLGASLEDCWRVANSLSMVRGSAVPLSRDSAFLMRRDAEIRDIDVTRERARARLGVATTPSAQAMAAREVSTAYAGAAAALAPLATHSTSLRAIVAQLEANAAAYGRIARDLETQDRAALARDRRSALAGETRLKTLLNG